jgi:SAM-dependent methyltransferase
MVADAGPNGSSTFLIPPARGSHTLVLDTLPMNQVPSGWVEEGTGSPSQERFWIGACPADRALRWHPRGPVVDIGCGAHKQPGTIGVDQRRVNGVDVVSDFERGLPFRDSSVAGVYSIHSIEHMRDLTTFMEELYRVCAPSAKVYVKTPYYASRKAFVDPTHVRFMTEESFGYFTSPNYYGLKTNFRILAISYNMRKPFKWFPEYVRKRCRRYLWNVCEEMSVVLEAVKP